MKTNKIINNPSLLKSLTGFSQAKFNELLPSFEKAFHEAQINKPRKRSPGAGRKRGEEIGSIKYLLVFILFYFKIYPIQELQGFLFGISQERACEWIHILTPILNKALGYEICLPARKTKDLAEVLKNYPDLNMALDGVGRHTQRPVKNQEKLYSGKSHRHEYKNILACDYEHKIVYLSPTYAGSVHDKRICDDEEFEPPDGSNIWRDKGFEGQVFKNKVRIFQPKKKPRGKELTDDEKRENRNISKVRVVIENQIRSVKIHGIVKDIYRNKKAGFEDSVMETACGLHNFKTRKAA